MRAFHWGIQVCHCHLDGPELSVPCLGEAVAWYMITPSTALQPFNVEPVVPWSTVRGQTIFRAEEQPSCPWQLDSVSPPEGKDSLYTSEPFLVRALLTSKSHPGNTLELQEVADHVYGSCPVHGQGHDVLAMLFRSRLCCPYRLVMQLSSMAPACRAHASCSRVRHASGCTVPQGHHPILAAAE